MHAPSVRPPSLSVSLLQSSTAPRECPRPCRASPSGLELLPQQLVWLFQRFGEPRPELAGGDLARGKLTDSPQVHSGLSGKPELAGGDHACGK